MVSTSHSPIAEAAAKIFHETVDMMQLAKDVGAFKGQAGAISTNKTADVAAQAVTGVASDTSRGL